MKDVKNRPLKNFLMSTHFNVTFEMMIAEKGNNALGLWLRIVQYIYSNKGYYMHYDITSKETQFLVSTKFSSTIKETKDLVGYMIENGIFNKEIFDKHGILTSQIIQQNYLNYHKRSKKVEIAQEIDLMPKEEQTKKYEWEG